MQLFEEPHLVWMHGFRMANVRSRIDPVGQRRKPFLEHRQSLIAAAGEAFFLPDFVEAPRIALIAAEEIAATISPLRE